MKYILYYNNYRDRSKILYKYDIITLTKCIINIQMFEYIT